ncbi:MAG: hypothetical protein IANPNBLG_01274 [Bryobacteraceae bacterium]|nr:hypothetical protein [Bryobacteraceae bacterium]
MEVRIEHRGEQVVRRSHGVEVAVEVEIDHPGGDDLGAPASGGSSLETEHRAEGRLAQRDDGAAAGAGQPLRQSDGDDCLPFSVACRRDGGDQNQLSPRRAVSVEKREVQFGGEPAIVPKVVFGDFQPGGNFADGFQGGGHAGLSQPPHWRAAAANACRRCNRRCRRGGFRCRRRVGECDRARRFR